MRTENEILRDMFELTKDMHIGTQKMMLTLIMELQRSHILDVQEQVNKAIAAMKTAYDSQSNILETKLNNILGMEK